MHHHAAQPGQCQHLKTNGIRCGSPALRGDRFCYFHRQRRSRPRPSSKLQIHIPPLEDANAVQVGLMEVIDGILAGQLTDKQAALLLYALQTASANLKRVKFEPLSCSFGPAETLQLARLWLRHRRKQRTTAAASAEPSPDHQRPSPDHGVARGLTPLAAAP